jgi:hypothetical protein
LVSANEIPPGGEGKITVKVKVGTRRGKFQQTVRVETNIPDQDVTLLNVSGNVLVDIEAVPGLLRFEANQTTTQVVLKNYAATPVQIHEIQSPSEYVKVSVSATTIPAEGEIVVNAELLPGAPEELVISGWVKLLSNLKTMPEFQIGVWAHIQKK